MEVARRIAEAAQAAARKPLFVDLNAVSPATARRIRDEVAAAGIDMVDGSISGPPPWQGGTRIYVSGPRASQIAGIEPAGLDIRMLDERVGTASALKMCTASVYKGTALILTYALRTAMLQGVLDPVLGDLEASLPDLVEGASAWIAASASKSGRYVAEMLEIAATQSEAGLPVPLFEQIAQAYAAIERTPLAGLTPEQASEAQDLRAVLEALEMPS